jgi:hypothetical protein
LGTSSTWGSTPSIGSTRNNGLGTTSTWGSTPSIGSTRSNGLGTTSTWGSTLNSKRKCSGFGC